MSEKWIDSCFIDLDFSGIESQLSDPTLQDIGPIANYGILMDDYKVNYTKNPIKIEKTKPTIRTKISNNKKGKAY